jgi:hypothetical protein
MVDRRLTNESDSQSPQYMRGSSRAHHQNIRSPEYSRTCVNTSRPNLHSDPLQSVECGGLLLGAVPSPQVEITDFEPFHLDSSLSRLFVLTEAERARLGNTIRKLAEKNTKAVVVGYFRSSLRGGLQLSSDDVSLIKEHFREPDQVFLVVTPEQDGAATAGLFFWESGEIFGRRHIHAVSVRRAAVKTIKPPGASCR